MNPETQIEELKRQIAEKDKEIRHVQQNTEQLKDNCETLEIQIATLRGVLDRFSVPQPVPTPKDPLFEALENRDLTAVNKILHPDHAK